ncbi:olfactory receptor 1361-like [Spea bombifrons]|uniref:olfactory receptor 1361-like n=1 Tax=Spea bombifrons TaxID=233779 RepID=UPI002349CEB8|nr:olfactory receptor 1361-like [Spea bombifrons]
METCNSTAETGFLILGFSDFSFDGVLLTCFMVIYVVTLLGNLLIISVIVLNPPLQQPMNFFLCNLSLVDMSLSTAVLPKLLVNRVMQTQRISFRGCLSQMYFFTCFGNMENLVLVVMSYDRYVAICKPLQYVFVMDRRTCVLLVAVSFLFVNAHSWLHTALTARLCYCGAHEIRHFFCEMTALLHLSCSDTSLNELLIFTEGSLSIKVPFLLIVISYFHILASVLKIPSAQGRLKTFSTCCSHLMSVSLFYGSLFFIYFRPSSLYSVGNDRFVSIMYTTITPMLNPFIYCFRNQEVKKILRKHIRMTYSGKRRKCRFSCN